MEPQMLNNLRNFVRVSGVAMTLLFALSISPAVSAAGQVADPQNKYDLTLQPISAVALKQALRSHSDDSVLIYQLVLRAIRQKEVDVAYNTLKTLRHDQPNNAVVLAGYCLAFDVYEGKYSGPDGTVHSFSGTEEYDYFQTLSRAHQLDPKLWMTYAVEGHNSTGTPAQDIRCLKLYQKAEELAPHISYTHLLLGDAYATYYTPYHSFEKAAAEYNIALSLQPISAKAVYLLFDIYDIRIPNVAKAKQAKSKLLSLLPPDFHLKKQASERLARY